MIKVTPTDRYTLTSPSRWRDKHVAYLKNATRNFKGDNYAILSFHLNGPFKLVFASASR